jgi:hypothetical protein
VIRTRQLPVAALVEQANRVSRSRPRDATSALREYLRS